MKQLHKIDMASKTAHVEVIKAFEAIVNQLPGTTVRFFAKRLDAKLNEVKEKGIERLNGELFLAECGVIFQLAEERPLPPEHMALVNKLRELIH